MGSVAGTAEACGCSGPVQISFRATDRSSKVAKAKTEMITDLHVALINLNYSTTVDVEGRPRPENMTSNPDVEHER
jgi:hypothetical protein